MKKKLSFILICLFLFVANSQTTDLATSVEAQDLSGNDISQVTIFQDFQYITTITNSGDDTTNVTFTQTLNAQLTISSYNSQNAIGGASDVTNLDDTNNIISGTIVNMPSNSSVQVRIIVTAPTQIGGIATSASVSPPSGTTDTNTNNNTSIISIDVIDAPIDFTISHSQINPTEGDPITAWGDSVTYEFTITNNSTIAFPITNFSGQIELATSQDFGRPVIELESLECISSTNGVSCPDLSNIPNSTFTLNNSVTSFTFSGQIIFPPNSSLTFEMVYKYLEPICGTEQQPIAVDSFIETELNPTDEFPVTSNTVQTDLLIADLCDFTDVCIETEQISPTVGTVVNYGDPITFETVACNNGPSDVFMRFFLQNLSPVTWEITSLECISTTGPVSCDDLSLTIANQFWTSGDFTLQAGTTITIRTTLHYIEPDCFTGGSTINAHVRSGTNILNSLIFDPVTSNDYDDDFVLINQTADACSPPSHLTVTKTQIIPQPPEGSDEDNTTAWGEITYEIVATNPNGDDAQIELSDVMTSFNIGDATASLVSVECVSTTGTASCQSISEVNTGVVFDGENDDDGNPDIFWQITEDDNWILPANSSITFHVVIDWQPICSFDPIEVRNRVYLTNLENSHQSSAFSDTFFAPCVDLVVQTFPEFTQVGVNQAFNWIIDISNSSTSSPAFDVVFENLLDPSFTITGTPTCTNTSGNATCPTSFNVSTNFIDTVIPFIDTGSTIRIEIPVSAPDSGGAYTNTAEAIPSEINNEELTPETNISISSVQVVSPSLIKSFNPETIISGEESILTFTVFNTSSNAAQENIAFTDNLPNGIVLSGAPTWEAANGCTGNFIGNIGDPFIGITDLTFPDGVESCTFSVAVTSNIIGFYTNDALNFSDQLNIDTSNTLATLTVIEDPSNVDIEVVKSVTPQDVALGESVEFEITITNLGTTEATAIEILDALPDGYSFIDANATLGVFDETTNLWSLANLLPNESATLIITAATVDIINLVNTASLFSLNEIDRDETNNIDTAEVSINNCLEPYEGLSPNGDQSNDFFIIPCIESFPSNNLKIFNRLGVLVYEKDNYENDWNGKANRGILNTNKLLPVGTYFYVLDGSDISKKKIGWVYLNY